RSESLRLLLRQIVTGARDYAMRATVAEFRRGRLAVGCGDDAVAGAIHRDRRHRNYRQRRQLALDVGILRIILGKTVAMAIAVDRHVDKVRIVKGGRRSREARVVEIPVWRPLLPEDLRDVTAVGRKTCPPALDLEVILIPERHLLRYGRRPHRARDVLNEI